MHASALAASLLLSAAVLVAAAQEPSGRIHVRYIDFHGTTGIGDQVLRREMLQLEATVLDTVALQQSRLRLLALPYVEDVRMDLRPVPGSQDVVDVVFTVDQAPARFYGGGGAYSESMRGSIHGYLTNTNLLGTGQRLSLQADLSELRSITEISHTEPYATPAGVSRTVTLSGRRIDALTTATSPLGADLYGFDWEYGYRVGDVQRLGLGASLRHTRLATGDGASEQLVSWVAGNGSSRELDGRFTTRFRTFDLLLEWRHDTRDRTAFPTRGLEQTVDLRAAFPGSDVGYYLLNYRLASHWPLGERWIATARARLGFGASYGGDTTSLPPYLNWFAGGPDSVRGFRDNRLGPRDSLGNPYGGNLLVAGQLELMTSWPRRWQDRVRVGFFYDLGNVFSTEDVVFADSDGRRIDHDFRFSELRHAAGVAAHWLIPFGTLRISYGIALNADENTDRSLRDETDRIQVAIDVGL